MREYFILRVLDADEGDVEKEGGSRYIVFFFFFSLY